MKISIRPVRINLTKEEFKRLFLFFSTILLADYPLLPILSALLSGEINDCEYGFIQCIAISALFIALIGFFWCASWMINYIVFIMDDCREKPLKHFNVVARFYIKYVQRVYLPNEYAKSSVFIILALECIGALWLFFFEISEIIKKILT